MNLNAYDDISPVINKQKTWINIDKQQLLSREIKYRKYITISKRFNKDTGEHDYFIILLDECPTNRTFSFTKKDDYGRIKINLLPIWNECSLCSYNKNINIELKHIEHSDDGDVYQLDV